MRIFRNLTIALVVVLVPVVAGAAGGHDQISFGTSKLAAGRIAPTTTDGRMVTVPVNLGNTTELVAVDLPLRFGNVGDGIELVDVDFSNGRASYFDETISNIDNENKTVIIGMISMVYKDQPDLATGSGFVADLTFEVTDPTLDAFTISATTMENPHHKVMFVYNDYTSDGPVVNWTEPEFSGITVSLTEVEAAKSVPVDFSLNQNYPNPFNAGTVITFALPQDGDVSLDVYNVLGQRVISLASGHHEAGTYNVQWDGVDNSGRMVASGMYFYRLNTPSFTETRKMTLLK